MTSMSADALSSRQAQQNDVDSSPTTSQVLKTTSTANQENSNNHSENSSSSSIVADERTCWICFATDEDNRSATWVRPCKCRGTMQWVHQTCLYRWIDEKQRGNSSTKAVVCPQCQTEYIVISPPMSKLASILESCNLFVKRMSPFLAASLFVSSLYWSAVTFGAITYLQIFGHSDGISMLEESDILTLLIGLPAIPLCLVLGRLVQWESAVLALIRNRRGVLRKFPILKCILSCPDDEDETMQPIQSQTSINFREPISGTRVVCGALVMPSVSQLVGRVLYDSIGNRLHRTLLGGFTFVFVKGLLKIYLMDRQCTRRKMRRIVDYNEENLQAYRAQQDFPLSRRLLFESSSLRLLAEL